eukprot:scaffold14602_cov31-Attheya_sp.AAC.1
MGSAGVIASIACRTHDVPIMHDDTKIDTPQRRASMPLKAWQVLRRLKFQLCFAEEGDPGSR